MKKILIVDDSETSILYLKMMLPDYEVISALNGKEMWGALNEHYPSLILLDIMLPDTNGYELVEQLSKIEKYKDIPVIFQTAKSSSDDLEKGFESGASDYVRKPVDKKELRARIKSVLKIKELEHQLYTKTITDYLTEIYNRRYFFEIAEKYLTICQGFKKELCIAILDIDFFKKINDTFGHDAGDFVLKKFSEIITQIKKPADILARYGGEEFIILFLETDISTANETLLHIQDEVAKQDFLFKDKNLKFTFSAGIGSLHEFNEKIQLDELVKLADKKLYKAKESGRNKIITENH